MIIPKTQKRDFRIVAVESTNGLFHIMEKWTAPGRHHKERLLKVMPVRTSLEDAEQRARSYEIGVNNGLAEEVSDNLR